MLQLPPVLILAYYYPPDIASGAARPYRHTKYLAKLGHDVRVISSRTASSPLDGAPDIDRILAEGDGDERTGISGFIERCFRKAIFHHDPGVVWVPRVVAHALSLYRKREQPVILSSAPPITTHLAGLILKLWHGWRWIADCRDPLTGNPFRRSSATVKTDPYFERLMFRYADAVIANTDTVAALWAERYPRWKHKIHVVWNGFDPENAPAALPIVGGSPRTLAHVGVIYGDRDPLPILAEISSLMNAKLLSPRQLRVCLYGPIEPTSEHALSALHSIAQQGWLEMRNEIIPKQEAAKLTAGVDYLLLLDVLGDAAGLQVPAKLFEYICIGRPILASTAPGSPVAAILSKSDIPHLCYSSSGDEMTRRMVEFFSLPPEPAKPSEWFQTTFNARDQAKFISNLTVSISKQRSGNAETA
jgi:glycosyltransferase involved in cell wall biosynthesis